MKLTQMEYFLAVAHHLNYTAAARALYLSQPALSRQISQLEEELGIQLFERSSRNVRLTAAGAQLQTDLTRLMEELELAKARAIQTAMEQELQLRIGCFDGVVVDDFLPQFYRCLHSYAPNIHTTLIRGSFHKNRKALEQGQIDLLFTLSAEYIPCHGVQVQEMARRRSALVYSETSQLARLPHPGRDDFNMQPYLTVERSKAQGIYDHTMYSLAWMGIEPQKILELPNFSTLMAHLEMGHGYAVLGEIITDSIRGMKKVLLPEALDTKVIAVWPSRQRLVSCIMAQYRDKFEEWQ